MMVLVLGTPDSGKSRAAEDLVLELAGGMKKIYLATMIPYGEEGRARVEKHRKMREGKGFETIEAPFDICEAFEKYMEESGSDPAGAAVLLECLSNLTANELFERKKGAEEAAVKVAADVKRLSAEAGLLVAVSNHFKDDGSFDPETREYACLMDRINEELEPAADRTVKV